MKIISWNGHGLNSCKKRALVKGLLQQQNPSIVLLRETKLDDTDSHIIKYIWSYPFIDWTTLDVIDTLGGLLIIWRSPDFTLLEELDDLVGLGGDSWINGGDLNITRWSWEKSHDQFIPNNMQLFNQWIANYHLRDIVTLDHFPPAMIACDIDWGPCPFRIEKSWLSTPLFLPLVETWWTNNRVAGWPGHGLMMKLKALIMFFRSWNNNQFGEAT
ncbi:hypothetical protein Csa_002929 [Cucumis sativus]|nr:hypothetical protein Csa_002929 [Cucumis sativus]